MILLHTEFSMTKATLHDFRSFNILLESTLNVLVLLVRSLMFVMKYPDGFTEAVVKSNQILNLF